MSKLLGLTLLALAFTITYVSACKCLVRSNEDKFCQEKFARAFKILDNSTTVGTATVFDVELLQTYRTVPITNVDETKLYTPIDPAACGITLRKDAYYVVSGRYIEKSGKPTLMATGRCYLQLYFASDPRGPDIYQPQECDKPEPPEPEETQNVDVKQ